MKMIEEALFDHPPVAVHIPKVRSHLRPTAARVLARPATRPLKPLLEWNTTARAERALRNGTEPFPPPPGMVIHLTIMHQRLGNMT
jgi:hypothetical protein